VNPSKHNASSLTDCGLPGIKDVPYGVHMCQFYARREELIAALVPYFAAGLRNRERCIWICANPLSAAEARHELRNYGIDVDAVIDKGALIVRDFSDWYAEAGNLKGTAVVDLWLAEEERALREGYNGLRITGNTSFLTAETWSTFMEYEDAVNRRFPERRIVTLCTYHLPDCGATEVLEVAQRHSCTIERPDEGWRIVSR
jgi:hypothetical protein